MERLARSFLFVPGDRPDRFGKAADSGADQVVIDLEDAVAPAAKAAARDAVAAWLRPGRRSAVRINAADTAWFEEDLYLARSLPAATLMLPKADAESLERVTAALPDRPVIALIETVKGYLGLRRLAAMPGLSRIAFGSVDFAAETGIADEDEAMTPVRVQIVLESCHAGIAPPIDGVSTGFGDEAALQRQALRSRQLGFGGKLCIHPRQVSAVNLAFRPAPERVEWARRVLAAFAASGGGVTTVDGHMIDKPVVEQARRVLADAGGEGDPRG